MTTINKYRVYCSTENKYRYTFCLTTPTECPVDAGHTLIPNRTSTRKRIETIDINYSCSPYKISTKNITADTTNGDIIINLPKLNNNKNQTLFFNKTGTANDLIFQPYNGNTIDSTGSYTLTANGYQIVEAGETNWTLRSNTNYKDVVLNIDKDTFPELTEKGQLLVDNGFEMSTLDVGANGTILCADSSLINGIGWRTQYQMATIKDVKGIGTNGGTFNNDTWTTRDLNTLDIIGGNTFVSLTSNQFTLQSGKYSIVGRIPAYSVDYHQCKLYNITDTADEQIGSSAYSKNTQTFSHFETFIDISTAKTYEVRHYCSFGKFGDGLGRSCGFGDEIYATIVIIKLE